MATIEVQQAESSGTQGLKGGSLGLLAVIVIGVASTAPGYSLAASIYVFAKTVWDARSTDYGYGTLFGVGTVLVIGTLLLAIGVPLMLWCSKRYPKFFTYRPDPVDLVKDPNSTDTLAAPLGTYTNELATRGKGR